MSPPSRKPATSLLPFVGVCLSLSTAVYHAKAHGLLSSGSSAKKDDDVPVTKINWPRVETGSSSVHLGVGDKLSVTLWGNPVTGRRWVRANADDNACVSSKGPTFKEDAPQEPSLGGTWTFVFTTDKCCETTVEFNYEEEDREVSAELGTKDATYSVEVKIRPSPASLKFGDGCSLENKDDGEDDSWFV
ncbi:unnamed protein product [Amoebophrya sp. A120]|nr:unnamed protein product [Amoebophrya sp. A120]|eukprot:GSA120T00022697001.1